MHRGKGMKFVGDSRVKVNGRQLNRPKDYSEYPGKTEAFWPDFLLKEWMVGAVFLVGYLLLTVAHPSPLEGPADPTNAGYIPLPDWYFLFVYQLLKYSYASGPYNIIGAIVIPGIAFTALLLMPFLDTTPERRPSKRPTVTAFMLLAIASIFYLTWESVEHHDWEQTKAQGQFDAEAIMSGKKDLDITQFSDMEGYKLWVEEGDAGPAGSCISCHGENLEGGMGPKLSETGLTKEEVEHIMINGTESGAMPAGLFTGTDEEMDKIAEFISSLKEEDAE